MRHGKKFNHLGRKTAHRKAMLSNMAGSLIEHKRVMTTVQKAKALRKVIEPLVTRSKENTTHNRRIAFAVLRQKEVVTELFNVVGPKVGDRPGGYTRIIKTGNRQGDNAEMCMIELVDFNDMYGKDEKKKTTRRSRRAKTETAPVVEEAAPVAEAPAAVEESKEESAE
ncbi:MAG: 50S ribosomal protein L17 [Cryomorphaceae bacterium]|jgi:large subunit ribosomal protein L17|nr:50S ribosomal protein L17 [Cryomorphaceae bacterium]MDG1534896.1 50S ribosomal protein L17 [Schleiferiaceae bacterium]|tara:strand:+ start:272 stop:775 length:504 start_codon:yes stop_codon:yes gene_type:complete